MFKIALIGVGGRGEDMLEGFLASGDRSEIAALCDPNPVRMKVVGKKYGINPAFFGSIPEMLANIKLDGAVITSPDFCHEANAVALLKGDVNILIDKPLAPTVAAAKNIIEAAKNTGKKLMMGFNMRHCTVIIKMKELIDAGEIGEVYLIENREFYDGGRTYFGRWNGTYNKSGGLWLHKGCHDFDVFHYLMNFPRPVRVSSFAGMNVFRPDKIPFALKAGEKPGPTCRHCAYKAVCKDYNGISDDMLQMFGDEAEKADGYNRDKCIYLSDLSTHDNGFAMIEYENGARAMHMECFGTSITDRRYTVVGTMGQLEASTHRDNEVILHKRFDRGREVRFKFTPEPGHHGGADLRLIRKFRRMLAGEETEFVSLEQGLWATAVGEAAEIARRQCRIVEIKELL